MTLRIRYIVILLILAAFMPRAAAQDETQKKEGSESEKKKAVLQAIPDSLEEMLARALRSNPDIH